MDPKVQVAVFAAALAVAGGCSEGGAADDARTRAPKAEARQAPSSPCPPLPSEKEASAAEIDRITDAAMREALAGRAAQGPQERSAARAKVVLACLHRQAAGQPANISEAEAVNAAVSACAEVIDRFLKTEGSEAALAGEVPPDRTAMTQIRAGFAQAAAAHVRAKRTGACAPPAP